MQFLLKYFLGILSYFPSICGGNKLRFLHLLGLGSLGMICVSMKNHLYINSAGLYFNFWQYYYILLKQRVCS